MSVTDDYQHLLVHGEVIRRPEDVAAWRKEMRRLARADGKSIRTSSRGDAVIAYLPDLHAELDDLRQQREDARERGDVHRERELDARLGEHGNSYAQEHKLVEDAFRSIGDS